MSIGIVTSKIRRKSNWPSTTIDGLPVVLKAGKVLFVDGGGASSSD